MHKYVCQRVSGEVIVPRVRVATTHWQKFRGLMLDTTLGVDEALWIADCNAIHCCFMKLDIDVLFLDKSGVVLYIVERMKPWTFSKFVRGGASVLECSAGTIASHKLRIGERLVMNEDF